MDLALVFDRDRKVFRKGVDDAGADAVKAARHLVAPAAELAAGMEHREDDLQSGYAHLGVYARRYPPAVVIYPYDIPRQDIDLDMGAVAGQRLVYGVVDYFVYQVVKPPG